MASTMASTTALSRPSEKLGTHSTSVDITGKNKGSPLAAQLDGGWRKPLRFALHLGPPPTDTHQQEAPIVKKFRFFVLKGVADELKKPAKDKESGSEHPQRMIKNGSHRQRQRHHDQRNAKAMAAPVDWMCMAAGVLCDPLFAAASTRHGRIITQRSATAASAEKPALARHGRGYPP